MAHYHAGTYGHAGPLSGQGTFKGIDRRHRPSRIVQVILDPGPTEHYVQQRGPLS